MQLDTAFAAALSRCDDDRRLRVLVRANEVDRFRAIELQCDRNGLTDRKLHENLSRRDRKAALAVGIVASPNREDDLLSLVGMDLPRRSRTKRRAPQPAVGCRAPGSRAAPREAEVLVVSY